MRNCVQVIAEMIAKIPQTAENLHLIESLEWNQTDAAYKAPEDDIQWGRTMTTLQNHIVNPNQDWQFEVLSIFTAKSIPELKILFQKLKDEETSNSSTLSE